MGLAPVVATAAAANLGFHEPILVVPGDDHSLIRQIRSAVIIPADTHRDLWVHPEFFTVPGRPPRVELRTHTTDRFGKDAHTSFNYFTTPDGFRTLQPLPGPSAGVWDRKDLSTKRLATPLDPTLQVPTSLGHTWCSAYVMLDTETILQAFTTRQGTRYAVQSLAARITPEGLRPLYVSPAHTASTGRGLYEPHLAVFQDRCYMTVRAEDRRGYVLVSEDRGRTWSKPRPWTWDGGESIPMNQTMTKFAAHADGLVLVYTRIRDDNENAFRHRSPLHVADVDLKTLSLRRATERIIVPNRSTGPKGLPVGNFWVWPYNDRETYVTVAEWPRDGRPQNGDVWLAKIEWKQPNLLINSDGRERVPSPPAPPR